MAIEIDVINSPSKATAEEPTQNSLARIEGLNPAPVLRAFAARFQGCPGKKAPASFRGGQPSSADTSAAIARKF